MSFPEMLEELPKLMQQQRRELALRLCEINTSKAETEDLAACEHSAALGFAMLDQREAEKTASILPPLAS